MGNRGVIFATALLSAVLFLASCGDGRTGSRHKAGGKTTAATSSGKEIKTGRTIELSPSVVDEGGADTIYLGRIRSGETVVYDLILKNAGSEPMVITKVDLTCGCVEIDYPRQPLKPGEEVSMELRFDSSGLQGRVFKTSFIHTSFGHKPYTLIINAEVN